MSDEPIPPLGNPYRTPAAAGGYSGGDSPVEVSIVSMSDKEALNWGMFCHLASLAGFVAPFGNIVGPLVVWLIKRDAHPFVNANGKESLNFQVSVTIYELVIFALLILLSLATHSFFAMVLIVGGTWIMAIVTLVYTVIAAVKANKGQVFQYPFTIRFLK